MFSVKDKKSIRKQGRIAKIRTKVTHLESLVKHHWQDKRLGELGDNKTFEIKRRDKDNDK